jgi:hypothetical protein
MRTGREAGAADAVLLSAAHLAGLGEAAPADLAEWESRAGVPARMEARFLEFTRTGAGEALAEARGLLEMFVAAAPEEARDRLVSGVAHHRRVFEAAGGAKRV